MQKLAIVHANLWILLILKVSLHSTYIIKICICYKLQAAECRLIFSLLCNYLIVSKIISSLFLYGCLQSLMNEDLAVTLASAAGITCSDKYAAEHLMRAPLTN